MDNSESRMSSAEQAEKIFAEEAARKTEGDVKRAKTTERQKAVIEKKMSAEPSAELAEGIRKEIMASAEKARENNEQVWVPDAEGKLTPARVLGVAPDGSIALSYRGSDGLLKYEARTAEQYEKDQNTAVEKKMEVNESLERGKEIIASPMEKLKEAAPKIFDQVTKSKWGLANRAGKFLTGLIGSGSLAAEKMKSKAVEFIPDTVSMAINDAKKIGRLTGDVARPETVEIDGQEVMPVESGLISAPLEMLWGAPRDVLKAIKKSKELETESAEAKLDFEAMDYQAITGRKSGILESFTQTLEKGFRWGASPLELAAKDIIRPTIEGNMEMVSAIQRKLKEVATAFREEDEELSAELAAQAEVELGDTLEDIRTIEEDLEWEEMKLNAVIEAENEKLDKVLSDKRYEAIEKSVKDKLKQEEVTRLNDAARAKRELDAILADMKAMEAAEEEERLADRHKPKANEKTRLIPRQKKGQGAA